MKRHERSQFVSEVIRKKELKKAYLSSNKDEGQREAMDEWESIISDDSNPKENLAKSPCI